MEIHQPGREPDNPLQHPAVIGFQTLLRSDAETSPTFHNDLEGECQRLIEAKVPTSMLEPLLKDAFSAVQDGHSLSILGKALGQMNDSLESGIPHDRWNNLTESFSKAAAPYLHVSPLETPPLLMEALSSLPSKPVARLLSEVARGLVMSNDTIRSADSLIINLDPFNDPRRTEAVTILADFGSVALAQLSGIETYTEEKASIARDDLRRLGKQSLEEVISAERKRRDLQSYPTVGFQEFPNEIEVRNASFGELHADIRYQFAPPQQSNNPDHFSECRVRLYYTEKERPVLVFSYDKLSFGEHPINKLAFHVAKISRFFHFKRFPGVYIVDPLSDGGFETTEIEITESGKRKPLSFGFDPNQHFIKELGVNQPGFVPLAA